MTPALRLSILYPAPSPHACDLFSALAARPDVDLKVTFLLPRLAERPGWPAPTLDFPHAFLPVRRLARAEFAVWNPGIMSTVRQGIADGRIHLLGGGYTMPSIAAAMLALNARRAPWCFFSEKPGYSASRIKGMIRRALINATLRGCTGILAASPAAAEAYGALGFNSDRIHFLPYAMRVDEFRAIERPATESHAPLRLLYLGRLLEVKGIDWALRALTEMPHPDQWTLTIAGSGPLESELARIISETGVRNITMVGEIPWADRARLMAEHDALLFPSRHDGFGMAVMEALAAGMPVLGSSAAGAVTAFVVDGHNGRVFAPEDAEGLRESLAWCILNRAAFDSMRAAARASVAQWTPESVAESLVQILSAAPKP